MDDSKIKALKLQKVRNVEYKNKSFHFSSEKEWLELYRQSVENEETFWRKVRVYYSKSLVFIYNKNLTPYTLFDFSFINISTLASNEEY